MPVYFRILIALLLVDCARCDDFLGGSLVFAPVNKSFLSSTNPITINIIQTYLWKTPTWWYSWFRRVVDWLSPCRLICVSPCPNSVSPQSISISSLSYVDASDNLEVYITRRVDTLRDSAGNRFSLMFQKSTLWNSFIGTTDLWGLVSHIGLFIRPDGKINSSPQAALVSPVTIILNPLLPVIISIAVIDPDNDTIRCRFSNRTGECGQVCTTNSLPDNATLSENCTLTFRGAQANHWYAVSIQVGP
jgi:hypothetical protein